MDLFDLQSSLVHAFGARASKAILLYVYDDDSLSENLDTAKELKGYIFKNRYGQKLFVYKDYAPQAMSYNKACEFCSEIMFKGVPCSPGNANVLAWDLFSKERNELLLKAGMQPIDNRKVWSTTPYAYNHWVVNPVSRGLDCGRNFEDFYVRPVCFVH